VARLDEHYEQLKDSARGQLGSLYNEADYPPSLKDLFAVEWDYPNVEAPDYLRRLNPRLYQEEQERVAARFQEAVGLAEQAFVGELAKLVDHLVDRLGREADGSKKVFRDSAVENLSEFFERFRNLSVGGNEELEKLVATAQQAISGVEPQAIRNSDNLRQHVATRLSTVAASLDQLLVDQPRRKILRLARGD
jgi:hypothetical protein